MAGPIADPGLRSPDREGEGHERGAEIVDTNRKALRGALEELRTVHARELEVCAEPRGELLSLEWSAVLVEEHATGRRRVRMSDAMRFESANDVVTEAPRTRIVGLRLIEDDDPLVEIEVAPLKARSFAVTCALAAEEAVENAPFARDIRAGHQGLVFLRINERLRTRGTELRQEAVRQRMGRNYLAGVDGEREDAVDRLAVVPERRLRAALGDRGEHLFSVLDPEVDEDDVAD